MIARKFLTSGEAMITSKLTSKAQTTIPQPVRAALNLHEGDALQYTFEGSRVVLSKVEARAADDPFRTFDEWYGDADEQAYASL
jgi:antitoxin PrlF